MNRTKLFALTMLCGLPVSAAIAQPCGTPWSLSPAAGPSARSHSAVAYDSVRSRVVLFGGANLTDTWEWAAAGPGGGGSWTLGAATGPSARSFAGMAYDSARQKTVLFGGQVFGQALSNQTWEWNGTTWTQMAPVVSPPPMVGMLMAYDVSRQRIVLVSTLDQGSGGGITWEYNGTTWAQFADLAPIANNYTSLSLSYDSARSVMVLVGSAYSTGSYVAGTWERAASGWSLRNTDTLPLYAYAGPSTTYDPARQRVLYFDNLAYSNTVGVWGWDGATWSAISSAGPALAVGRRPTYDVAGNQVVLFGGTLASNSTTLSQTWLFRSDAREGPTLTDIGQRSAYREIDGPLLHLTVAATGTPPISYQWRLNGVVLSDGGVFSGTSTPQFTVDPTDRVYSGYYDCIVTDACGITTRPATYLLIECYPNCDGSTSAPSLNAEDFQCFLNAYASGSPYANCDGSTAFPTLNANDFQCYLNKFAAGCP